ncbi:DtxR family transcriptional regulator [Coraliomargarita parva]|uniref:metal-dependent transcriptional regulator n=1 Tax=Coraliomargarita parva TaxID=3014050 RepID=UPI0022B4A3D6|nr:iron dependent repressor, metal binding and dimerization domain protein [Coraliomargarita parva]
MFDRNRNESDLGEDFLKHAAANTSAGEDLPVSRIVDMLELPAGEEVSLLGQLKDEGLIQDSDGGWQLTQSGWTRGRELIRAHRIYESYLAESTGMHPSEWHAEADQQEHRLDSEEVNRMAIELNRPRFDPHGDAIPTRRLEMEEPQGLLLSQVSENGYYRLVHLEDEPADPFKRTVAAGLAPDLVLRVEVLNGGRYRVGWAGQEEVLDSAQAAACLVQVCEADTSNLPTGNLASLPVGEWASLHSISPAVRGLQRRRLLDLGFVPGSRVGKEGVAAFKGPMRFRVRGTMQALRPELAAMIYTKGKEESH